MQNKQTQLPLTSEQQAIVTNVAVGKNILVDACIGSGKTSVLAEIYRQNPNKKILYLTFNKLLKEEARKRLEWRQGSIITNYHSFVMSYLKGLKENLPPIDEFLGVFVKHVRSGQIVLPQNWDLVMIDEYQDINEGMAEVLECVKQANPSIQILAVGDMMQKIYDNTSLDVQHWLKGFIGKHVQIGLTNCFRLSKNHAAMLGRVWEKPINGVNENCQIEHINLAKAVELASNYNIEDILCLGGKAGLRNDLQNQLEEKYPQKFNKYTLYSDIKEKDGNATKDTSEAAVFTTFDASKGMERKICFICDFTKSYWSLRSTQDTKYEILRNLFCVGASRGKEKIYFVAENPKDLLDESTLKKRFDTTYRKSYSISTMFDFKKKENIDKCFKLLQTQKKEQSDHKIIPTKTYDGFIDLTPCMGIYQEVSYFKNFDIKKEWKSIRRTEFKDKISRKFITEMTTTKEYAMYLTAVETGQQRYCDQVEVDFMEYEAERDLHKRIGAILPIDAPVQVPSPLDFGIFDVNGLCDVFYNNTPYELKFVKELKNEHFLQCACYILALGRPEGILWNTRDNTMYTVQIPDEDKFCNAIRDCIRDV
ncbi:MAG: AAA family ATPase [Defluviitaleaceae bacterium]|nr:AAA family ATPase [Defluviitaleaceae bacterium]